MVSKWVQLSKTKTGTMWHNDDQKLSITTMIEKEKGIYVWKVKTIKGRSARMRTLRTFKTQPKATAYALKWMRSNIKAENRRDKTKAVAKKIGSKLKKAYKDYQSPEAKKKRAKARKARDKKMAAAQKQFGMGGSGKFSF